MIGDQAKAAKAILGLADEAEKPAGGEVQFDPSTGLKAASEELLESFKAGDSARLASALRSAFAILEAEPHEEAGEE